MAWRSLRIGSFVYGRWIRPHPIPGMAANAATRHHFPMRDITVLLKSGPFRDYRHGRYGRLN